MRCGVTCRPENRRRALPGVPAAREHREGSVEAENQAGAGAAYKRGSGVGPVRAAFSREHTRRRAGNGNRRRRSVRIVGAPSRPPVARRETGIERRGSVRPSSGAAVGAFPVSRNPSPSHSTNVGAASCRDRLRRRGGRRVSGGEGRCALRARPFLPRLPLPVSRALPRSGPGFQARFLSLFRRGWKPLPQMGYRSRVTVHSGLCTVTRILCPPAKRARLPAAAACGAETGDGCRKAKGGARSARGLLIFPVSRNPSPVHCQRGSDILPRTRIAALRPHRPQADS